VEPEHAVVHEYDTADRDLERLGMRIARLPSEAGVVWRLDLPRGERVEAWEPGTDGLAPPAEIMRFVGAVVADKPLVPAPPAPGDPGARRLRALLAAQRRSLQVHDPGSRLGADTENLHQHRVAARRSRAFLRATRAHVDPGWRRELAEPLKRLGEATGPVRDLDVLLEHLEPQLRALDSAEGQGAGTLVWLLTQRRDEARKRLLDALDEDGYRRLLARLHLPPRLRDGVETIPLERIARREFRRLARTLDRLGKHPDDVAVHGLRIALKHARYAAELYAPEGKAGRALLEAAKTLQLLLGEHQDAVVAESLLRSSTVVDARTGAAFVAGRMAERQVVRRERVKAQLPGAWRRLRKRGGRL
jgi:CHAD domain-containing protein